MSWDQNDFELMQQLVKATREQTTQLARIADVLETGKVTITTAGDDFLLVSTT